MIVRLRELPGHVLRVLFIWASRRRGLARVAARMPLSRQIVARFVAGETLPLALDACARLKAAGLHTTLDVLGESVASPEAARAAADRYVELLDALAARGLDGNVSLKLTQMGLVVDPALCRENVARVTARAAQTGAFVRVDMEDSTKTEATLAIVRELRAATPEVGVVVQSYLRRSADDIERLIAEGTRVRLCKGAYNEPDEVAFETKAEVDASYRRLLERLLSAGNYPAIATHDPKLVAAVTDFARREHIDPSRFEFQMLYGIRRDLQSQLARDGWTVRVYVPFGSEWYPYFMRRLAERPANVIFLLRSVLREGR
ncbi:MAG: proline dehydrogenase family protein [Candidatus Limnocylindrales bacterium]